LKLFSSTLNRWRCPHVIKIFRGLWRKRIQVAQPSLLHPWLGVAQGVIILTRRCLLHLFLRDHGRISGNRRPIYRYELFRVKLCIFFNLCSFKSFCCIFKRLTNNTFLRFSQINCISRNKNADSVCIIFAFLSIKYLLMNLYEVGTDSVYVRCKTINPPKIVHNRAKSFAEKGRNETIKNIPNWKKD
jgi:hypothetical protein